MTKLIAHKYLNVIAYCQIQLSDTGGSEAETIRQNIEKNSILLSVWKRTYGRCCSKIKAKEVRNPPHGTKMDIRISMQELIEIKNWHAQQISGKKNKRCTYNNLHV